MDIKIEFIVDRFSILFKKPEYKLARASIDKFEMRMIMFEKTHRYSGSLQKEWSLNKLSKKIFRTKGTIEYSELINKTPDLV